MCRSYPEWKGPSLTACACVCVCVCVRVCVCVSVCRYLGGRHAELRLSVLLLCCGDDPGCRVPGPGASGQAVAMLRQEGAPAGGRRDGRAGRLTSAQIGDAPGLPGGGCRHGDGPQNEAENGRPSQTLSLKCGVTLAVGERPRLTRGFFRETSSQAAVDVFSHGFSHGPCSGPMKNKVIFCRTETEFLVPVAVGLSSSVLRPVPGLKTKTAFTLSFCAQPLL